MGASRSWSLVLRMDTVPSKIPVIPKRNERCKRMGSGREDHFIGLEYLVKVKKRSLHEFNPISFG
jgi:hypothetical protein